MALSIQPETFENLETATNEQKFPGKVSRNSAESCLISAMRTIQPKVLEIPGAKLSRKKTFGKKFRKFGYASRGCPLFWKSWKILFHSLLEFAEISNQMFKLNGKSAQSVLY